MNGLMWATLLFPVLNAFAGSVEVLSRTRTGSTSEDATYVDGGKWAGRVAFLDGLDVLVTGAETEPGSVKGTQGLCRDVRGEGKAIGHLKCPTRAEQVAFAFSASAGWHPRGLAYISSTSEFVFNDFVRGDGSRPNTYPLVFTNEDGVVTRTVAVQAKDGATPDFFEGLDYLPPTHPVFPDRIAALMYQVGNPSLPPLNIAIIRLDGVVEHHIPLGHDAFAFGAGALAVLGDDRFVVAPYAPEVFEVNLAGELVGGPHHVPDAASVEGVDFYPDGRIFMADYGYGRAWTFDAAFQPLPDSTITFGPSLGLARNLSVMEDPSSDSLLVFSWPETVYRVPRELGSKAQVLDVRASGLTHFDALGVEVLPETERIVLPHYGFAAPNGEIWPRALSYFEAPYDPSASFAWFPVRPRETGFPLRGRISQLVYLPTTAELLVRLTRNFPENRNRFLVYGMDGSYRRTLTLPVADFQSAAFLYPTAQAPAGALAILSEGRVDVVSLDGVTLESHDFAGGTYLDGVVQDETDLTGRTLIGVSAEPSELVRFKLP